METTQRILLNKSRNKKEANENASLNVALSGDRKLLPEDAINDSLNSYEVYLDERKNGNKFRLIFTINPYCTNVLFNPLTEIVKNEGSSNAICLNFEAKKTSEELETYCDIKEGTILGKRSDIAPNFKWNQYEAIRDTQLSNRECDFEYHCGIDVFNNHILRSRTFKTVNYHFNNSKKALGKYGLWQTEEEEDIYGYSYREVKVNNKNISHIYIDKNFNTIDDYMRDRTGYVISEEFPKLYRRSTVSGVMFGERILNVTYPLHLYQNYDIYSFKDCVKEKLIEDNGWYGFSNPSTFGVVTLDSVDTESRLNINKVINSKNYCDFIDMYPGRDLYSFTPKYNEHRKRFEKNWNYCITYPSKNVIKNGNGSNFPFFDIDSSGETSLKVYMFDEGTVDDDGTPLVTIYTVCQHGLMVGDIVNIYKSNKLFYDSVEVVNVIDKYIFQIFKGNGNMSEHWVEVTNRNSYNVGITNVYSYMDEHGSVTTPSPQKILNGVFKAGNDYFPICESNRCNVDKNAQNISIRRVVNGVECKYYVRKFSRLPNFKFKDEEVNDFTLYDDDYVKNHKKNGLTLIERFSKPGDENSLDESKKPVCFESHAAKLGFANTSYNDDTTEIVFTDDIDVSYLRDNLGRPLSDIYLTIVKSNKGYKEWYGIGKGIELNSIDVEYSHCFGKVNSSFLLSEYYREYCKVSDKESLFDVRDITANPLKVKSLFKNSTTDDIEFDKDWEYYGDICCYSPVDCDEQVIQTTMQRFNTVQRELKNLNASAYEKLNYGTGETGTIYYDEIYEVEKILPFHKSNGGDPYDKFKNGSESPKSLDEITSEDLNLYHTTKEKLKNMFDLQEGYYYQPHYRIPIKTVSSELKIDNPFEYEILSIKDSETITDKERKLFEFKTATDNWFCENEKVVLYKRSTNEYYFVTVYGIIDQYKFTCTIADEFGNHLSAIEGIFDINNIDDYILVKKHDETPDYARLIKDGSCRYCWREVVSNGVESDEMVYPFTNGAFYISKQINFFLRRQDPKKVNLAYTNAGYDFVPDGEDIHKYPNFNPVYKTNYEANEIEEC